MKKHRKNTQKEINKIIKGENRKKALQDGSYDGRFRTRVVKDKKKTASKQACRKYRKGNQNPEP